MRHDQGMGFGMRIAPGLRISASGRGLRVGLGPRAARLHVGAGRPSISTGYGPFTYWTPLSGGGRRRASMSSYAASERAEQAAEMAELEHRLTSFHLHPFGTARAPVAPPPEPVDEAALLGEHRARERAGFGPLAFTARRAAKARAAGTAAAAAQAETTCRADERTELQQRLDAGWARLLANEPKTVLTVLETAFADNEAPAAPIDCAEGRASVVILADPLSAIPVRKRAVTPSGVPTLHQRTKTERCQLYLAYLASTVLATVKEAFAVAPRLAEVAVLVVHQDLAAASPQDYVTAVYAGRFPRSRYEGRDWAALDVVEELYTAPDALLRRVGQTGELAPLELSDEPELTAVMAELRAALAEGPR